MAGVARALTVRQAVLVSLRALSHLIPTLVLRGVDGDYLYFTGEETEF